MKKLSYVILVLVLLLPIIAAYFSFGEVFTNMSQPKLSVALVNEDKGATFNHDTFEFGKAFVKQIEQHEEYDWSIVSRGLAEKGIRENYYDLVVFIPDDFSEKALQVDSENPEFATLNYKTNPNSSFFEKSNAEATIGKLESVMNQEIVDVYFAMMIDNLQQAQENTLAIVDGEKGYSSLLSEDVNENITDVTTQMSQLTESQVARSQGVDGFVTTATGLQEGHQESVEGLTGYLESYNDFQEVVSTDYQALMDYQVALHAYDQETNAASVNEMIESTEALSAEVQTMFAEGSTQLLDNANSVKSMMNDNGAQIDALALAITNYISLQPPVPENPDGMSQMQLDLYNALLGVLSTADGRMTLNDISSLPASKFESTMREFALRLDADPGMILNSALKTQMNDVIQICNSLGYEMAGQFEPDQSNGIEVTTKKIPTYTYHFQEDILIPGYSGDRLKVTITPTNPTMPAPPIPENSIYSGYDLVVNDHPATFEEDHYEVIWQPLQTEFNKEGVLDLSMQYIPQEGIIVTPLTEITFDIKIETLEPIEPIDSRVIIPQDDGELKYTGTGKLFHFDPAELDMILSDVKQAGNKDFYQRAAFYKQYFQMQSLISLYYTDGTVASYQALVAYLNEPVPPGEPAHTPMMFAAGETAEQPSHSIYWLLEHQALDAASFSKTLTAVTSAQIETRYNELLNRLGSLKVANDANLANVDNLITMLISTGENVNQLYGETNGLIAEMERWRATHEELVVEQDQSMAYQQENQLQLTVSLGEEFTSIMERSQAILEESQAYITFANEFDDSMTDIVQDTETTRQSTQAVEASAKSIQEDINASIDENEDYANTFSQVLNNSTVGDHENELFYQFISGPVQTEDISKNADDRQAVFPFFVIVIAMLSALFTAFAFMNQKRKMITTGSFDDETHRVRRNHTHTICLSLVAVVEGIILAIISGQAAGLVGTDMIFWTILLSFILLCFVTVFHYLLVQLKTVGMFMIILLFMSYLFLNDLLGFKLAPDSFAQMVQDGSPLNVIEKYIKSFLFEDQLPNYWLIVGLFLTSTLAIVGNLFIKEAVPVRTENTETGNPVQVGEQV